MSRSWQRQYQAYLFDLDGTLVDTAPDISAALNFALKQAGLNPVSEELTRHWVGHGSKTLIAEAHAELDAIETVMFRNYDVMTDLAGNQGGIPLIDRVKFRYDASLVLEKCLSVVDKLFANAGGASVFIGSEIQKLFLDVHTARAHVANNPVGFSRNFGAMQLGVENTDYFV